jgi:hypothetical protein
LPTLIARPTVQERLASLLRQRDLVRRILKACPQKKITLDRLFELAPETRTDPERLGQVQAGLDNAGSMFVVEEPGEEEEEEARAVRRRREEAGDPEAR